MGRGVKVGIAVAGGGARDAGRVVGRVRQVRRVHQPGRRLGHVPLPSRPLAHRRLDRRRPDVDGSPARPSPPSTACRLTKLCPVGLPAGVRPGGRRRRPRCGPARRNEHCVPQPTVQLAASSTAGAPPGLVSRHRERVDLEASGRPDHTDHDQWWAGLASDHL